MLGIHPLDRSGTREQTVAIRWGWLGKSVAFLGRAIPRQAAWVVQAEPEPEPESRSKPRTTLLLGGCCFSSSWEALLWLPSRKDRNLQARWAPPSSSRRSVFYHGNREHLSIYHPQCSTGALQVFRVFCFLDKNLIAWVDLGFTPCPRQQELQDRTSKSRP